MFSRSKVESRPLALGLISIIASGCAAGMGYQPHGRAAGEWSVTLPSVASYSQGLAYGRGGTAARVEDDVDALLLADAYMPQVAADRGAKRPTQQRKPRADHTPPASTVPAQPTPAPVVPASTRTERTEVALNDQAALGRYEVREAQSQTQQRFAGGDAIVIGASTLVLVILIVLLVLLLV